ncbi:hypothetical protein B9Z55_015948 [Caenorhabditis nigoni]|nr:hypothetical protein B9Z55_015948 [Caenorhabditis nigoni]
MSEELENVPKVDAEPEKIDESVEKVEVEPMEEEAVVKDLVPEMYRLHGGDPRLVNLNFAVMVSGIPTDFINDSYEQFDETLRTMLCASHNLRSETILKIIRIPVLEEGDNKNNALRALICFSDKIQQCRCLARKKAFEDEKQRVEAIDTLPEALLFISDEDRQILEDGVHERPEGGDDEDDVVGEEVDELELEEDDEEEGHDEHEEDSEADGDAKKDGEAADSEVGVKKSSDAKEGDKKAAEVAKKPEPPKKKVYEDEDEKAPFEMVWEGAPEFQWRLCEGNRDEKKLIIENLMWSDLNDVFIYRTIQKATSVEINFPARFSGEGSRQIFGKLVLHFPAFVAIMDEALKHLIYFRSGDARRIKVFLPQTTVSLKRKEEFEGKLGRLIKPTPRMMELVIKTLPEGYTPTLDNACEWFPDQSVIGCELVKDEMGSPCAIVKFETAQEAVAAHASRSFVIIRHKEAKKNTSAGEPEKEGEEKKDEEKEKNKDEQSGEREKTTRCNVFMRGVEAHFGSLITYYDQRRRTAEQQRQARHKRQSTVAAAPKRPAGSTIRGPVLKKRAPSPSKRGNAQEKSSTPRGGSSAPRRGASSGGRRSSPPRSGGSRPSPRGSSSSRGGGGGHPRGGSSGGPSGRGGPRGGRSDRGMSRSNQRTHSYRNDSFSSSTSSQRAPPRADAFAGYGYAQFDRAYNSGSGGGQDRPSVDPFGRPMYSVPAFSNSSSSSFRHDDHRGGSGGFGSSSSFDNRRRY